MWDELWIALALMLVIEGIFPFLNPSALREVLMNIQEMDDKTLRTGGLLSMLAGLLILYITNG